MARLAANLAAAPVEFDDRDSLNEVLHSVAAAPDFSFALVLKGSGELVAYVGEEPLRAERVRRASEAARRREGFEPGVLVLEEPLERSGRALGRLVVGLYTQRVESAMHRHRLRDGALSIGATFIAIAVVGSLLRSIRERNQRIEYDRALLQRTGTLARVGGWELLLPSRALRLDDEASRLLGGNDGAEVLRLIEGAGPALTSCIEQETPFDLEIQLGDDPPRWLRVHGEADRGERLLGALQDVTEQHLAREATLAASKAKTHFLANTSHEMRTPLNGILGMTNLALETPLTPEQRSYLEAVRLSGRNMLATVNDLLDLSRVESGKLTLELVPARLDELLVDALRSLSSQAQAKDVELIVSVSTSFEVGRRVDPLRLTQVVNNLVGNAVKFTQSGEVELRLEEGATPDEVVLSVRDTGIGVPRDRQAAIFEAFTQADGSTSRQFGGTGLGLTITRELVRLMGGTLTLESEPGVGSTFTARLGLERVSGLGAIPEVPVRRALIVGLNRAAMKAAEQLLARLGAHAEWVESIGAAHGLEESFDVVLLDVSCLKGIEHLSLAGLGPVFVLAPFGLHGVVPDAIRVLSKPLLEREVATALRGPTGERPIVELAESEPARTLEVLLAEDNVVNASLARRLIEKAGHVVTHVWNGLAVVEATQAKSFDLVLMDVQMPELDGLEATRKIRLREKNAGGHVFVVAMTANAMKSDQDLCLEAGMDDFLCKPIDFGKLRHLLMECAARPLRLAS